MARYRITTLVDITRTNPQRTDHDPLHLAQQANFDSLIQSIGIRSNVEWDLDPEALEGKVPSGIKATYWMWDFYAEREDIFRRDDDAAGLLVDDLNNVPIIGNLTNSVELTPSAFITKGENPNTWVRELKSLK
jgi:hypothetical protein